MLKITVRQLETFLAVAASGSFSNAARHLNLAQPAVSQAIKDLEGELGIRLFDRTTRRVVLTDAGREFQGTAGHVVGDLEHALRNARDLATRRRGRIRIAAAPLLAEIVLPQAIVDFQRLFPGIVIELVDVGTKQIVESVQSGRADCGLGTFPPGDEDVERTVLTRDQLMLFCSSGSPLAGSRERLRWRDLGGSPLIALTRDSGIRLLVEIGYEAAQLPLRPAYEVSLISTVLAMVDAGLGFSILPTYAVGAARHRQIVARALEEPAITRDVVLIQGRGRSASPALSAFNSVLRRHVQRVKSAVPEL